MKKLFQFSLLLLGLTATMSCFAQKQIKEGSIKFELADMGSDAPEMAMMNGTKMDFYFTKEIQRMDMNMMGGMMRIQVFVPATKPADGTILMDVMGQKFQLTNLTEDDLINSNNMLNTDGIESVVYDEKDTKTVAGYPCYRADVKMSTGMSATYYICEKIQPPMQVKKDAKNQLKGFPLELSIDTGMGVSMKFEAKEVVKGVSKEEITVNAEGYTKKTMEEFQKEMGGLNIGGGN
ncbi:MAG: DUF4412 domain-containing protein [Saprospiraceae bacterium]|nr:MAG: DUF4412 domain-containing protein [Saprospiraceae bacterium]